MNGYPLLKLRDERAAALQRCGEHLLQALRQLRAAHDINTVHALGLELPSDREIASALGNCGERLIRTENGHD